MRTIDRRLISALAICLVASGCAGSSSTAGRSARTAYATDGTFTMAVTTDLANFDPYRGSVFYLAGLAYDSMLNLRPDGKFVSGLADKWSADSGSATFTLRPDVTCSDGTPLTARQAAEDINWVMDLKNKSTQYGANTPTEPLTAAGDDANRTVTVTMKNRPFGFLLNTIGLLPIMCGEGLKSPAALKAGSAGTGPFVLEKIVAGQTYTFTRRKDYKWGPGGATTATPGTPAKVVLKVIENETTAANALLTGQLNLAMATGEDEQRLAGRGLEKIVTAAPNAGLRLNEMAGRVTADNRVRRALIRALDVQKIIKVSTGGTGGPATGLVLVEPKPCPDDTVAGQFANFDVGAAKALLDQAGWTAGSGGVRAKNGKRLTIEMHYRPDLSSFDKPTTEIIASYWRAIGVDVRIKSETGTTSGETFKTGNWDTYMGLGTAVLPSQWVPYLSGPNSPNGTNVGGVHNSDYERLAAKAATMTVPAACTYWNQAEQALYRDVDIVPLSNRVSPYYMWKAQAQTAGYSLPIPTSIRVLK